MHGATPPDWASSLLGARLCGRYQLTQQIGLGGMGAVFAGVHEMTGREVAVKLLLPLLAGEEIAMRRFEQEAQSAAQISRRGAVEILDFDVDPVHGPFMVMERLHGQSLGRRLTSGALPIDEALFVAREVLETLVEVHERGIVHRDLKPGNIFLALAENDGPRFAVKLLDFGISRVAASDRATKLTRTGVLLGTVRYMPPEQVRYASKVDHRADLYALGAILSYALTGQPPYAEHKGTAVLLALTQGPPRRVAEIAPSIPAAISALVDRAMEREPAARFPGAAAFRDAIDAAVGGGDTPTLSGAATLSDSQIMASEIEPPARTVASIAPAAAPPATFISSAPVSQPGEPQGVSKAPTTVAPHPPSTHSAGRAASVGVGIVAGLIVLVVVIVVAGVGALLWHGTQGVEPEMTVSDVSPVASPVAAQPLPTEGQTVEARAATKVVSPAAAPTIGRPDREGIPELSPEAFWLAGQVTTAKLYIRRGERAAAQRRLREAIERHRQTGGERLRDADPYLAQAHMILGQILTEDLDLNVSAHPERDFISTIRTRHDVARDHLTTALRLGTIEMNSCSMFRRGQLDERIVEIFETRMQETTSGRTETLLRALIQAHLTLASNYYNNALLNAHLDGNCSLEARAALERITRHQQRLGLTYNQMPVKNR